MDGNLNTIGKSLCKYAGAFPFILMCGNISGFIVFLNAIWIGKFTACHEKYLAVGKQFFTLSFGSLILLFAFYNMYRFVSKLSFWCLVMLWVLNTIYVSADLQPDLYYSGIAILIYLTFAILTVGKLTNCY